jgi:hypothetical protein
LREVVLSSEVRFEAEETLENQGYNKTAHPDGRTPTTYANI